MIRFEHPFTLPTKHGELHDVPMVVDFDPETGVAEVVSADITLMVLSAKDMALVCDMRHVNACVQRHCDDNATAIIDDARRAALSAAE